MSSDSGWTEIPRFEFEFRGVDGSSANFASTMMLSYRSASAVVAFDTVIEIRTSHLTFRQEFVFAEYGGFFRFRDELNAVRDGTGKSALLSGVGFSMTVESHDDGLRDGLLIHGYCSSISDVSHSPWPEQKPIGDLVLLDKADAACVRFAFLSSLANPVSLDETLSQVNALIRFLRDEGYSD